MKEGVLFEIGRENLETGMRGYPVGYCTTSYVDPVQGLFYLGQPIKELASNTPEEVIYLLYYGSAPTDVELTQFKKELRKRSAVSPEVIKHIHQLPKKGSPMKLFSASLLLLGMLEGTNDYREDCLNLIAKAPTIVAALINDHAGFGGLLDSKPELGYIENFVHMLRLPIPKTPDLVEVMKLFNILHYDHGGGNLSTFVGKAVASGLEDMYGSMSSSICALAGPRHGRANQDCLEFIESILKEVGPDATVADVEKLLRHKLDKNELIFGFGHAVLRVEDPRATIFYDIVAEKYSGHPLVKVAMTLREAGIKVLSENPKISDPYPNVDAISGIALIAAGFNYSIYFPVLFGLSRCVGIAKQIVYERAEARGGKGLPIVRPKYFYIGNEEVSG